MRFQPPRIRFCVRLQIANWAISQPSRWACGIRKKCHISRIQSQSISLSSLTLALQKNLPPASYWAKNRLGTIKTSCKTFETFNWFHPTT